MSAGNDVVRGALSMARRDDPEALAIAAETIRAEVERAIERDAAVYGMAAETVSLGEDY